MNADEINKTQDDYDRICYAIQAAIAADRSLVVGENWVAHLCSADTVLHFSVCDDMMFVNMTVYTVQTGGSYEYPEAQIPLDTLNKYLK